MTEHSAQQRFRLAALDLDGTLLDEHGALTQRTIATVHEVIARGVTIVLATSRRFVGTAPVAEALGLNGPLILYDGAQIREYPSGVILMSNELERPTALKAITAIGTQGLRPIVQYADDTGERLLVGPPVDASDYELEYVQRFSQQITELPLEKLADEPASLLRVVAFGPLDRLTRAAEAVALLRGDSQLLPLGNYGVSELSVFSRGTSKGTALHWLAEQLGVPVEETLAIGDGINDVSMLSAAGLGIAMGNAEPETRAVASAFTASNAEDGVAVALERYILDAR